ncbi:MAG: hypothetical protein ACK4ML_00865 [Alishewanella aestuarii]
MSTKNIFIWRPVTVHTVLGLHPDNQRVETIRRRERETGMAVSALITEQEIEALLPAFKAVIGEEPRYVKLPNHFRIALFNNDNYCSYDDAMGNNALYIINRVISPEEIFNPDITEAIKYTLVAAAMCLEGEESLLRAAVICSDTLNLFAYLENF